ncbi:hypothetical protein SAY86_012922 [Trapa natans]|uniref:Uncharacterized protein n=1 Tax=Trapa natans TaxID=22666 RepID=A0AAN7REA2_TRANT|nr:hypothetical protein SAY86_012922 [Trapa natans]
MFTDTLFEVVLQTNAILCRVCFDLSLNKNTLMIYQGFRWYAKRLRIDEDGDVAHEFIDEVSSGTEDHKRQFPKFNVRYSTRPAKVMEQVMSIDGRIQHCVEHQALENAQEIPKTMKY